VLISAVNRTSSLDVNEHDIKPADGDFPKEPEGKFPANVGGSRKNRRVTKKARKNRRH
jgi:hypothetical protein